LEILHEIWSLRSQEDKKLAQLKQIHYSTKQHTLYTNMQFHPKQMSKI